MKQVNTSPQGVSLHLGLNSVDPSHYAGWSGPLQACENDAKNMLEIAKNSGFKTNILRTKEATKDAVIKLISSIAYELKEGDIFFLTYSGHGGQVPDRNHDEMDNNTGGATDFEDETWCLYDYELIDDQIFMLLSKFKAGVRIFVLSDSCHSGTVLRARITEKENIYTLSTNSEQVSNNTALIPPYKLMPPKIARETYEQNKEYYDSILKDKDLAKAQKNIQASAILISGCQDNQLSLDGTFNGMFTGAVLYIWDYGNFNGDYRTFRDKVTNSIHSSYNQTPNYYTVGKSNPNFEEQKVLTI